MRIFSRLCISCIPTAKPIARELCDADTFVFFFPQYVLFNCRRGATVHFSCDEGYELQGSKSISCLRVTDSYVGWSDDRPICRGKDWGASPLKLVPA